jgi:O-antigen/teichoic acid export membrane protein
MPGAGSSAELVAAARRTAGWGAFGAILVAALIVMTQPWLPYWLGGEFAGITPLLLILGAGQAVNASLGPNGMILQMTRHERPVMAVAWLQVAAVAVTLCVAVLSGEVIVAAAGVAGAVIAGNLALTLLLWRRCGFLLYPSLSLDDVLAEISVRRTTGKP